MEAQDLSCKVLFSISNFPSGGISRLPEARLTESVGQTSMQLAQAKQSGITLSRLRIAFMTVDGQALEHASQAMQVS